MSDNGSIHHYRTLLFGDKKVGELLKVWDQSASKRHYWQCHYRHDGLWPEVKVSLKLISKDYSFSEKSTIL